MPHPGGQPLLGEIPVNLNPGSGTILVRTPHTEGRGLFRKKVVRLLFGRDWCGPEDTGITAGGAAGGD